MKQTGVVVIGMHESLVGLWQRYGGKVDVNISNESILCNRCVKDYYQRKENRLSYQIPESSYQVIGHTFPTGTYKYYVITNAAFLDPSQSRPLLSCFGS